jgi:glucose/arabinose dehydrogenase
MKKIIVVSVLLAVIGIGLWFVEKRTNFLQSPVPRGEVVTLVPHDESKEQTPSGETGETVNRKPVVETVATGLDTPWGIVFTSPERMLVTERPGKIRVIENGKLLPDPLYVFREISETGEEGLLSLTLDPEYPQNQFLYLVVAVPKNGGIIDRVMRFRDTGTTLADPLVLIDDIPAARYHAGSRVAFGPDGKLYITTGDATDKNLAQDKKSLAGKVLRINRDGSIPGDNPFSGSPVWSYGHRNPQGLAWHPDNGFLYETEHGPSGFDGPGGGDEVNMIVKGKNYGWPLVSHEEKKSGTEAPLIVFTPAEAPASLLIYSGRQFSAWRDNLFFGALKGEGLMRLVLDDTDPKRVVYYEKLKEVDFGRIREVMEGPDGFIYFTTSNRDGRGNPAKEDDRIFRLRFE